MIKQGFSFEFELPRGWEESGTEKRIVAHGPHGEELIVSGSHVLGLGEASELAKVREEMLRNAFRSIERAADSPELEIVKPLQKGQRGSGPEHWTLFSQTKDGAILFAEAVVASQASVLLVTLEGPNNVASSELFADFLGSVRLLAGAS